MTKRTLYVKWETSERDDYLTCALREGGRKVASCSGGGYDMLGTVLGEWLSATYPDRLSKLNVKDKHNLCCIESVRQTAKAVGLQVILVGESKHIDIIEVTDELVSPRTPRSI